MKDYFWAKTTQDGRPGKSVLTHMRDVSASANVLLDGKDSLLAMYGIHRAVAAALAGLHDIGKISPGFQSKCKEWLRQNNFESVASNNAWDTLESDHAKLHNTRFRIFCRKIK